MRYSVFISYNHRDRKFASWLHRALETYRIPKALWGRDSPVGVIGRRLPPVFQDREELAASSNLAASVLEALEQASCLIAVCSPNGARSRWVNEEIRTFTRMGRRHRVQCLIVGGEPNASSIAGMDPALEALPAALFENDGQEPLASDIRPGQDGRTAAKLKLLAGVLDVQYDDLRRREVARRQRNMALITGASTAGFVAMSGLAVSAVLARNEAIQQRDIARQKTLTAERTVGFVKSMFEVADPSESKGATITAREILDRGAQQIADGLADEPSVKTELSVTLGEVYMGLGLFREGETLIRNTLSIPGRDRSAVVRQFTALGDAQVKQGDYQGAVKSYDLALAQARRPDSGRTDLIPRILIGLAEAQSSNGDFAAAERAAAEALRADRAALGPDHPDVARDLETQGLIAFYDNRFDAAQPPVEQALAIRLAKQGARHPKVSEDLNLLGSIAYMRGDPRQAEGFYRRVLANDEAVLGPSHPDLATTLNNLARMLLERRAFAEADPLLQRSAAITLQQRDETHNDLAFTFANLAMVRRAMGEPTEAEGLYRRALRAARAHAHRNTAPIMTDLADVLCARGASGEALALLAAARPIMAETYPNDPWRVAWLDSVHGGCLFRMGRRAEAAELIASSEPILEKRWPASSLYGWAARQRAREITARAKST